jgi:hypothetical protein
MAIGVTRGRTEPRDRGTVASLFGDVVVDSWRQHLDDVAMAK